jgi:hypothetical protein
MRVSSRAAELAVVVAPEEPVALVGLVEPAAQVVREALAVLAVQVVRAAQEAPAGLVVQEVVLALGIDLAAVPEPETGPVAGVLELRTAPVAEPETVQVEAVLVQSQPHAQLAVPLRIKSATAARRPGQVPLLAAEEDLAAVVAEITHGQAATEAATAWAAAE